MFELGIFLTLVGLMYTIYQKISNKTAFWGFCLILAAASGIAAYSIYHPHGEDLEANRIAREKIIAQQTVELLRQESGMMVQIIREVYQCHSLSFLQVIRIRITRIQIEVLVVAFLLFNRRILSVISIFLG